MVLITICIFESESIFKIRRAESRNTGYFPILFGVKRRYAVRLLARNRGFRLHVTESETACRGDVYFVPQKWGRRVAYRIFACALIGELDRYT